MIKEISNNKNKYEDDYNIFIKNIDMLRDKYSIRNNLDKFKVFK